MDLPAKNTYTNGQKIYELKDEILTYFFKNGTLKAQGPFINNKMEGKWIFYRENGQLWGIGHFIKVQKHGTWIRYNKKNVLEYEETFENGKQIKKKK